MSESVQTPTTKSASSFASLLESFTGAAKKTNQLWDDSLLSDDVATITYEQALRSHRRVPPASPLRESESQSAAAIAIPQPRPLSAPRRCKSASITIRLTKEEEAQLHQRAAAAHLSVSAYLRSCIFEAESLRAQVKEALSQMRSTITEEKKVCQKESSEQASSWRSRFLPRWSRDRESA
ncbi:hypothetical protein P8935_06040 [Telmatobacter sp. DSM 110680]|uniref:Ribbon-helix-helix protein, copG family n=1 Tax=Telmatobacter sp. DSM 110680 TaxID=3036704 RepID=A0AAU7DNK3_9BACT